MKSSKRIIGLHGGIRKVDGANKNKNGANIKSQCAYNEHNGILLFALNDLQQSDSESTKDKCDSAHAHGRHRSAMESN